MKNLIKSHMYQLSKSALAKLVCFCCLFIAAVNFMSEYNYYDGKYTVGRFIVEYGFTVLCMAVMLSVMLVGIICDMDFIDKTANYELMSGYTRKQSYFSKVIISLIVGMIAYIIMLAVPVVLGSIISDFGYELSIKEVIIRALVSVFPAIRIMCEFICIGFIIRNPYVIMGCGFLISVLGEMLPMIVSNPESIFLGLTCFFRLSQYESWTTYTLADTVNLIHVYGLRLTGDAVAEIIISSLLIGAFFILIGYTFYKRDDLR